MQKLTDEQVELARKAIVKEFGELNGGGIVLTINLLHVAAPYLQMPWDEPTTMELDAQMEDFICFPDDDSSTSRAYALRQFVRRRNAALLPKPVDTLDVERARRWLIKNHPMRECRDLAELLHDYSLSIEVKP